MSCYLRFVLLPLELDEWLDELDEWCVRCYVLLSLCNDLSTDLCEWFDVCLTVFVGLMKQFAISLGVTAIFLLNAMCC